MFLLSLLAQSTLMLQQLPLLHSLFLENIQIYVKKNIKQFV